MAPKLTAVASELVQLAMACSSSSHPVDSALGLIRAIDALPNSRLRGVDECVRSWSAQRPEQWLELDPRRLGRGGYPCEVAMVAASHGNGHVREAALRVLAEAGDARVLPFVLLRLNDWVAEVRRAARSALAGYVAPEFAPALVTLLPMIERLGLQGRGEHETVIAWVVKLLAAPELRDVRFAGCRDADLEVRTACLRFSLKAAPDDAPLLLELALADAEPKLRVLALRRIGAALPAAWARTLIDGALHDRSSQVRRIALDLLGEFLSPDEIVAITEAALLDVAAATRWQAQQLLARARSIDLAEFYRAALARPSTSMHTKGALLGLGECGQETDVLLVRPHLDSDLASVRRIAMQVLGKLEPTTVVAPFFLALSDRLPGVANAARRALGARTAHVRVERLLEILASSTAPVHARANAVALGSHLSKWDALFLMLTALDTPDSESLESVRIVVASWVRNYNRSFARPTGHQLVAIEAALDRARLDAAVRGEVRQIVHAARGVWGL